MIEFGILEFPCAIGNIQGGGVKLLGQFKRHFGHKYHNNNKNGYLERIARTGPMRLLIL